MSKEKKQAYVLFCDIRLKKDMDPIRYYIGVAKDKSKKDSMPWTYTMDRTRALRFKDNVTIGKFLSNFRKEIANIDKDKWNGAIYIQDSKTDNLVLDFVEIDKFIV